MAFLVHESLKSCMEVFQNTEPRMACWEGGCMYFRSYEQMLWVSSPAVSPSALPASPVVGWEELVISIFLAWAAERLPLCPLLRGAGSNPWPRTDLEFQGWPLASRWFPECNVCCHLPSKPGEAVAQPTSFLSCLLSTHSSVPTSPFPGATLLL